MALLILERDLKDMRISFDLDDTLICYNPDVPQEINRVPFFLHSWFKEPLRLGTIALMQELKNQGHSLCIYTTSYRSPQQVKRWFRFYGISIDTVINQELHERRLRLQGFEPYVSKYPPAFGIDLHIDDLEGVALEGKEHGFLVVVVSLTDPTWTQRILEAVQQAQMS